MNTLDLVLLAMIGLTAAAGFRIGFVSRVISWVGLGFGIWIGVHAARFLLDHLATDRQSLLVGLTIATLGVSGALGQWVGFAAGRFVRVPPFPALRTIDRCLGAVLAIGGLMTVLWLSTPLLVSAPGELSALATSSKVTQRLDDLLPPAPDALYALRHALATDAYPDVFAVLRPTPEVGAAPMTTGLSDFVRISAARSVVKIEGDACRRVQDGSGFVVSEDTIVTNAHVVAGEKQVTVFRDDGRRFSGRVALFDPERDLAVVVVNGLDRPWLSLGRDSTQSGSTGGVFGHPGGEPLRIAPFKVARTLDAKGLDIYGTASTSRRVLELGSTLRPGDSGSALIDADGQVVGVAFAISRDRTDVAYALDPSEVRAALAATSPNAVSTGPCLS